MNSIYGEIPISQLQAQKSHFYKEIISLLGQREDNYEYLDNHIQTIINQISGSNKLFNFQPEILTIISYLETARTDASQFRKAILDAANLVNALKEGDE